MLQSESKVRFLWIIYFSFWAAWALAKCVCVIQCMVQKRSSSSMHAGNVYRLLTGIASNLIAFLRWDWSSQNYALYLMGSASFYLILENSLNWLILNYEWGWLWAFPSLAYQFFYEIYTFINQTPRITLPGISLYDSYFILYQIQQHSDIFRQ